ncbi:MAG: hypothetical protein IH971_09030 [Candidatus Marinimicrobia bacterium]|nr:hypothetical protein [Candidatus Neomarinimicrobiota bacterium]
MAKTTWLRDQIDLGRSQIIERDAKAQIRAVSIARPMRTQGAYLKISWLPSSKRIGYPAGDVEVITYERPQDYGAELLPAEDLNDFEKEVVRAATFYGNEMVYCIRNRPYPDGTLVESIKYGPFSDFSNRDYDPILVKTYAHVFEVVEPQELIEAAVREGWKNWTFRAFHSD